MGAITIISPGPEVLNRGRYRHVFSAK
jgi:hypothetical protein